VANIQRLFDFRIDIIVVLCNTKIFMGMGRKEKKYHYIYKTTNLINGKYYIGMHSTDNLGDGYLGSGRRLRYSINKYGKENHKVEILEFVDTRKELAGREKDIVNLNEIVKKECMNLMVGGVGGFISEEQQRNRSIAGGEAFSKKLKNDENFRTEHSIRASNRLKKTHEEGKIKYDTFKGKKHTEETKKKMSKSSKGKGKGVENSQYGTCWITKNGNNKKIKKEELPEYTRQGWIRGRK
jgi:hypothetical protein